MISRLAVAALLALSAAPASVLADAGGAEEAMPPSDTGIPPPDVDMDPMDAPEEDPMDAEGPSEAPVGVSMPDTKKKDPNNPV
jgi:hypothetical protein